MNNVVKSITDKFSLYVWKKGIKKGKERKVNILYAMCTSYNSTISFAINCIAQIQSISLYTLDQIYLDPFNKGPCALRVCSFVFKPQCTIWTVLSIILHAVVYFAV